MNNFSKISLCFLLLLLGVSLGVNKVQAHSVWNSQDSCFSGSYANGYQLRSASVFETGQRFSTSTNMYISEIEMGNASTTYRLAKIEKIGSPTDGVIATIRLGGHSTIVATSTNTISGSNIGANPGTNQTWYFNDVLLTASTSYEIWFSRTVADFSNYYYIWTSNGCMDSAFNGHIWANYPNAQYSDFDATPRDLSLKITYQSSLTYCGDGTCDDGETADNCKADCQVCGDNVCNGDETPLTCVNDCPIINRYNDIIRMATDIVDMPLVPDSISVFYYTYNTNYITETGWGDMAYIHIDRCLDVGCSTTTPWYFTNADGSATSSESFILGKGIDYATTTNTFGTSMFLLKNRADDIGIATTTQEIYKITPTYITPNSLPPEVIEANAVAQVINWQSFNEVISCQQFSFNCSSATLCADLNLESLMNQIWCAFKGASCDTGQFFFVPDCQTLRTLNNSYLVFKSSFPFNVYFDLADSIDTAIDNTPTSSTSTFGIPFIDRNSTSSDKFIILPVVASSSLSNAIGSENVSVFRMTIGFLIWLVCAFIVYLIVLKI